MGSDEPRATRGEVAGAARGGWRTFRENEPGRRFRDLHRWRRENVGGGLRNVLVVVAGAAVAATGMVLMLIPGPGLLLLFFGLGIIGIESLLVARLLDRAEAMARGFVGRFRGGRRL